MEKRVLILFLFILLIGFPIVTAENTTKVEEAYSCLEGKIDDKTCASLTSEEKFFSLLALGKCKQEILDDSLNNESWGGIKPTAQAILALKDAAEDTTAAENWLLSQKATAVGEMVWYLEIESNEATTCTITYDDSPYEVFIRENKTIDQGAGPCLDLSANQYWLEISTTSPGCYEKEFEISCGQEGDPGFLTTLLFTKPESDTIHVLAETHTAQAGGTTAEQINSFCFSTTGSCDYEGSLWAVIVLDSLGHDVNSFMPYLISTAEDNAQYLPKAFLYILFKGLPEGTGYRTTLLSKQKLDKYWRESDDKFYDTAVALLPFQGSDEPTEKVNSKEWLVSERVQDVNGCWEGNIRNTAFLLYSIWPDLGPLDRDGDGNGDGNGDGTDCGNNICEVGEDTSSCPVDCDNTDCGDNVCDLSENPNTCPADCEDGNGDVTLDCGENNYDCRSSLSCYADEGFILDYSCAGTYVCCSVSAQQEFCEDRGGIVCDSGERCVDGIVENTQDLDYGEVCCVGGTCQETGPGGPGGADCEISGGTCRSFQCDEDEEETPFYSCVSGQVCCVEKTTPPSPGGAVWIIWTILILIILVVLAILFRNQLRKILFRLKSRGKPGRPGRPGSWRPGRPGPPPKYPAPLVGHPRRMPMPQRFTPRARPRPKPKGELDDVLKKLKDMGK